MSNDHQSRGPTRGRTKKCGLTGGVDNLDTDSLRTEPVTNEQKITGHALGILSQKMICLRREMSFPPVVGMGLAGALQAGTLSVAEYPNTIWQRRPVADCRWWAVWSATGHSTQKCALATRNTAGMRTFNINFWKCIASEDQDQKKGYVWKDTLCLRLSFPLSHSYTLSLCLSQREPPTSDHCRLSRI